MLSNEMVKCIFHICQLHEMILQNADEGKAGEFVRDQVEKYWHQFSQEDVMFLQILAGKLYDNILPEDLVVDWSLLDESAKKLIYGIE